MRRKQTRSFIRRMGGYFDDGPIDSYSDAVHKVLNVGFEGLLDSDIFYVDPPDRDVEPSSCLKLKWSVAVSFGTHYLH